MDDDESSSPRIKIPGQHDCQRCGIGPLLLGPLCPWCLKTAPVDSATED